MVFPDEIDLVLVDLKMRECTVFPGIIYNRDVIRVEKAYHNDEMKKNL